MLRTGQLLHPASTPTSRPTPGASLPGTLASPRTGLAPAGCRELVARLRHEVVSFLTAPELLDAHQGECLRNLLKMVPSGSKTAKTRTPRRVCRRLEPVKVEELIKGYSDGVPVDVLAGQFGVDQSTVQKHARRHDLPRRSPRLGPNQIKEAVTLYAEGQSLLKLAARFGVASDTVALALRRAGVTLRLRRGWTR